MKELKNTLKFLFLGTIMVAGTSSGARAQTADDTVYVSSPRYAEFSTAGFYKTENSGREVENFNVGWRFYKGDMPHAEEEIFSDSDWDLVSLPHGLELLPYRASGGKNYQGIAWYRKHFTVDNRMKGRKVFIYFEAIMGKCEIWLNGKPVAKHFGGFLPVVVDASSHVRFGGKTNVIAVKADNSNDPDYPPGKPQESMDFAYFGGIYRDAWLFSTSPVHITDSNRSGTAAGGGVFVHFEDFSEK
ncbi:MAG: hypothetical protein MI784_12780, partial [Cytophagales bacterium]|nr:hypothetical protein [Cytophagales bacterium]